MSDPFPIVVSQLAAEQIFTASDWWRATAPNHQPLRDDLAQATELLDLNPIAALVLGMSTL